MYFFSFLFYHIAGEGRRDKFARLKIRISLRFWAFGRYFFLYLSLLISLPEEFFLFLHVLCASALVAPTKKK